MALSSKQPRWDIYEIDNHLEGYLENEKVLDFYVR